jgi:hypothetical protein
VLAGLVNPHGQNGKRDVGENPPDGRKWMLDIKEIVGGYGEKRILHKVTLRVASSEIVGWSDRMAVGNQLFSSPFRAS